MMSLVLSNPVLRRTMESTGTAGGTLFFKTCYCKTVSLCTVVYFCCVMSVVELGIKLCVYILIPDQIYTRSSPLTPLLEQQTSSFSLLLMRNALQDLPPEALELADHH